MYLRITVIIRNYIRFLSSFSLLDSPLIMFQHAMTYYVDNDHSVTDNYMTSIGCRTNLNSKGLNSVLANFLMRLVMN